MGYVTCGLHPKQRCCWRCDRCPKCEQNAGTPIGRLTRGDYCKSCVAKMKAEGLVWSDYFQNYVSKEDAEQGAIAGERLNLWEARVQQLEAEGLTRSDAQAVADAEENRVPLS